MVNVFEWVAKQVGVGQAVKWGWKTAQWTAAWNAYENRIKEDYGKLFVLGKADPVPLENIYTAVNVLEKPSALRRYSPEQLHELFLKREALWLDGDKRRSGIDLVKSGKTLYILGKPGAGKTIFLKNIAIKTVQGIIGGKSPEMMPIFISLHAHANSGRTLLESIEHELSICRFPDVRLFVNHLLHSGRALILLDGLDEVKQEAEQRSKLIQEIKDFMREYRESQFLMTCRVAATEYEFENVTYLEMADFDDEQISTFIKKWFNNSEQGEKCWQELRKAENQGLQELARVPLLLTLLAITYEETLSFPNRRVEIYEEALDALLKKWDARRHIQRDESYKTLSLGRKRQMFARIAAQNFEANKFLIPEAELTKQISDYMQKLPDVKEEIDGQAVLESIAAQHGIFVERAKGVYSFAHLSFQEYYVAKYIIDNASTDTLGRLLDHILEDQWREILLLTVSSLDENSSNIFFAAFLKRKNHLIAKNHQLNALLASVNKQIKFIKDQLPYTEVATRMWLSHMISAENNDGFQPNYPKDMLHKLDPVLDYNSIIGFRLLILCSLTSARDLSHVLPNVPLEIAVPDLIGIDILKESDSDEKWDDLRLRLELIHKEYLSSSKLGLLESVAQKIQLKISQENYKVLGTYYKVSNLFIDCLNLATVTDREAILNQLFLPVEQA